MSKLQWPDSHNSLAEDPGTIHGCEGCVVGQFELTHYLLFPATSSTMPPISATAPTIGGNGNRLVLSVVT
jgi:hypothetical protein